MALKENTADILICIQTWEGRWYDKRVSKRICL